MKKIPFLTLLTPLAVMLFVNAGRAQQAPSITSQPVNQVVVENGSSTYLNFSVQAAGTSPLHYQWQFDGTNITQYYANSSFLSGQMVTTNYAGTYDVVITNAYGSVTSAVVALILAYPPAVTSQPVSLTVSNGGTASLSVGVSGTGPFSYQWLQNGKYITNNLITTVAGRGGQGFSGDGGAATNAILDQPAGLAVDGGGNVFIADRFNSRIRKMGSSGTISTVAGDNSVGYNGSTLVATNTSLYDPSAVAVDADNELFIADTANSRVRFEAYGELLTLAGNGSQGFVGDGGAAYNAQINQPTGVAVDASQNVFIVDVGNSRIRKVDVNDIITTVAGNGSYSFSGDGGIATNASLYLPTGSPAQASVAVDAGGNLFIADTGNNRIRRVDTNGIITTVAGRTGSGYSGDGGAATNATLNRPSGITIDALGNLYIADTYNQRVRKVSPAGIITTVAGNGGTGFLGDGGAATNALFDYPVGVAVDASGNFYISDTFNNRIRKVTTVGAVLTLSNVTVTNAGNYQVIVTSAYGSITSSIAALTVQVPPIITRQPAGQAIIVGDSAAFSVGAMGTAPLGYQWQYNGAVLTDGGNLSGSVTTNLVITQAATTNAGQYDIVITNVFGSVTSSVVNLIVSLPSISATPNADGSFTLNLVTATNTSSEVLATTNLTPPVVWLPLYTNVTGNNGSWQFTDTNASQYPTRFYRTSTP